MAAAGLGYSRGGGSAFIKDRRDFSSYNPVASAALGSTIPLEEEVRSLEAVRTAVDLGGDIQARSESGDTALHAAAAHGMDSLVTWLVERGANPDAENERGQTPRDRAVYADGIAGDSFVRESTAALLGPGADGGMSHPSEPHAHPDAQPWANPVEPTPESVRAGADTYASMCATCHGPTGRGDGRLAAATAAYGARPSNLADEVWQHGATVGEIFATIRDGVGPDYAMDGFGSRLTDTEIWNLVNYLRGFR